MNQDLKSLEAENMEDRYLYRAKRKSDKKWIYGNLIQTDDGVYIIQNYVPKHLIGKYDVDPSTICQYTGLKDKNGKLIWEKDVVRCEVGTAEVIWDKSGWRTKWLKNDLWRKDLHYWTVENSEGAEVIGNIFDNPELLESEE